MVRTSSRLVAGLLTFLAGLPCGAQASLAEQGRDAEDPRCSYLPGILCARTPAPGNETPPSPGGSEEGTRCSIDSLTPPKLLSHPALRYTPEALEARVQGRVLARCTLTEQGTVEDCRVIKGLPHMDEAVIELLKHSHYRPILRDGKPIRAQYLFTVKVMPP